MDKASKDMFKKYAVFKGRTSRSDFWLAILAYFILTLIACFTLGFTSGLLGEDASFAISLSSIWFLGTILPLLAMEVRRLHDINKSGWNILLGLIPFVGSIILIIFSCKPSVNEGNNY